MPCPTLRPSVSQKQLKDVLIEYYQICAKDVNKYHGYDDYSALVTSNDGQNFVFKALGVTNSCRLVYQCALGAILNHLHAHGIPVPRIIPPVNQATSDIYTPKRIQLFEHGEECSGHLIHLLSYIPGTPLDAYSDQTFLSIPQNLLHAIGQLLAKFHRYASSITSVKPSEFEPVESGWEQHDCIQVLEVLPMVDFSENCSQRVRKAIIDFDQSLKSNHGQLTTGLLHGDITACNIIITEFDPENPSQPPLLRGFIDFGEMCHSAIVHDLAQLVVSLVTLCHGERDEVEGQILCLLDGYISFAEHLPLTNVNLDHLYLSAHARFAQMLTLSWHDANIDPSSADYILSEFEETWKAWDKFSSFEEMKLVGAWKSLINKSN